MSGNNRNESFFGWLGRFFAGVVLVLPEILAILGGLSGGVSGNCLYADERANESGAEKTAEAKVSDEKTPALKAEAIAEKWGPLSWDAIRKRYQAWLTDSEQERQLKAVWDWDRQAADAATLEWLAKRAIQEKPEWGAFLADSAFEQSDLERGRLYDSAGLLTVLKSSGITEDLAADLRLYAAARLIQRNQYDAAAILLAGLEYKKSGGPGRLLFYQGLAAYAELDYDSAKRTIDQLLAGESVPVRYRTLGEQMKRDLENLDPKGLDHVSRRMGDSSSRLADGQTNPKVREIQDGIVKSLDDQIEKLEQQLQQMQPSSSPSSAPSGPAPQEYGPSAGRSAGQTGEANKPAKVFGDADGKNRKEDEWGSLPEKRREADLQQIQERFPPHYRDIIEQYFKKMAQ